MRKYRTEIDTIGEYKIPDGALYGSQTRRSYDSLHVTKIPMNIKIIKSIIKVKKAETLTYKKYELMSPEKVDAIVYACDEMLNNMSKYRRHFITDQIQGGAGTSVNMNVNEVLANIASTKLGKPLGAYSIHPNDDINKGQSTNDVFPTAGRITFIGETQKLIKKITKLQTSLKRASLRFDITRLGKTHLQDAVPINMSKIFTSWAHALERDKKRLKDNIYELLVINLGGTAVGTGILQYKSNIKDIYKNLREITKLDLKRAVDLVDGTRNTDVFLNLSNTIKTFITSMSKNCNDLRLLASGPSSGFAEIKMPEIQPGSSIMPGKVNPIIPETVNQIAFVIIGHNATVNYAVEAGQLELNVFEPVIFSTLLKSFDYAVRSTELLRDHVLHDIQPNKISITRNIENSSGYATAFNKEFGYSKISKINHNAILNNLNVKEELKKNLNLSEDQYQDIISKKNVFPLEDK